MFLFYSCTLRYELIGELRHCLATFCATKNLPLELSVEIRLKMKVHRFLGNMRILFLFNLYNSIFLVILQILRKRKYLCLSLFPIHF